jgi:FkbM family methyltransferase
MIQSAVRLGAAVIRRVPRLADLTFRTLRWSDVRLFRSLRFRLFKAWAAGLPADRLVRPVMLPGQVELMVDVRDWCGLLYIEPNAIEPVTTNYLLEALRQGDVFVDIGANVGYMSLLAASRVGPTGRVWCFEPNPRLLPLIAESIRRNHFGERVRSIAVALAEADDPDRPFHLSLDPANSGLSSLAPDAAHIAAGQMAGAPPIRVRAVTFDTFARENEIDRVDGVKIDVEGAEELVLRGMTGALARLRPRFIVCETGLESAAAQLLARSGYRGRMLEPLGESGTWGNVLFQPEGNRPLPPPAADPIDVSVILICWNSLELTTTAIRTLNATTVGVQYEVIVVDNGSAGGVAEELARRFPDVRLIANSDNRGFAAANNQALAIACGRHALLLNSDTEQTENAVGQAVAYLDAHPDVGVLGVLHRNGDPGRTYQPSAAAFPTPWGNVVGILRGLVPLRRSDFPIGPPPEGDVDWVTGSFFLVRRACLDAVGPLDERFFVYGEDIDWCFQAWRRGWKVRFWPGVALTHFGSSSASQVADKTFMLYRNNLEFFRKNSPPLATLVYYATMVARLGLSTLYQTVKWAIGQATWSEIQARWWRQWNFMTLQTDRRGLSVRNADPNHR